MTLAEIAAKYGHVPMGVHAPQWCAKCSEDMALMQDWVAWPCTFRAALEEAAAEERRALREILGVVEHSPERRRILAALDAREKEKP